LAVAVEEGHVDPAAFVGVVKVDDVGFVEEVGIEDDCAVLAVRASNRYGPVFLWKSLHLGLILVVIICGKIPMIGRFLPCFFFPPPSDLILMGSFRRFARRT